MKWRDIGNIEEKWSRGRPLTFILRYLKLEMGTTVFQLRGWRVSFQGRKFFPTPILMQFRSNPQPSPIVKLLTDWYSLEAKSTHLPRESNPGPVDW